MWRRRSGPSAPSTSLFFCLLDVRESRGAPRSCLGGPAFDPSLPSAATAGSVRSISHSWYSSRFSSRASRKKRAARNCCCRRHERSIGPTVPDSNRLGLKHGLSAGRWETVKAGTPPGAESQGQGKVAILVTMCAASATSLLHTHLERDGLHRRKSAPGAATHIIAEPQPPACSRGKDTWSGEKRRQAQTGSGRVNGSGSSREAA